MKTVFSAPLAASYVAEWHTDAIEDLKELAPDWARYAVLSDTDDPMRELQAPIKEVERRISESAQSVEMDPWIKAFAVKALARDAVVAASAGAAFSVTSLFEPLLADVDVEADASGRVALDILVPDVGRLPWESIAEYREHPGSKDARGKLREFEERALAAEPDDPLVFQREVFRSISEDLFAAVKELQGELSKEIAVEAVKTGISFVPVIGPFLGPGVSLAQAVADQVQHRHTWYAALIKLAEGQNPGHVTPL